jgi:LmbE family N-acetylglucosaminyl deacetylase
MLNTRLDNLRTVLCLGAHADDIEIGCGGTLLNLLAEHRSLEVYWVVLGAGGERSVEAQRSAESLLRDAASKKIVVREFRDGFFPYIGGEIKDFFHQLRDDISPDLIFTHRREDMHQDHRLTAELTWNVFRDHLILEYEIPKYEGDLGTPNVFVPLGEETCRRKIETITKHFPSQHEKPWFCKDLFWSLLRIRGVESNSPSKFAEGLYCRKLRLNCG